ncbi:MAG TPA: hypothetical protein DCL31_01780 [Clostridium sp.]|nr:hypothetical protein [Clostridium sp.]
MNYKKALIALSFSLCIVLGNISSAHAEIIRCSSHTWKVLKRSYYDTRTTNHKHEAGKDKYGKPVHIPCTITETYLMKELKCKDCDATNLTREHQSTKHSAH